MLLTDRNTLQTLEDKFTPIFALVSKYWVVTWQYILFCMLVKCGTNIVTNLWKSNAVDNILPVFCMGVKCDTLLQGKDIQITGVWKQCRGKYLDVRMVKGAIQNLRYLYRSPIAVDGLGHVTSMWETRNKYRISVGKLTGRKLEDNIKMDFRKMGWEGGRWMELA